jgi:hypothetical protein
MAARFGTVEWLVRQIKTDERLRIPIHPQLQAILDATPRDAT